MTKPALLDRVTLAETMPGRTAAFARIARVRALSRSTCPQMPKAETAQAAPDSMARSGIGPAALRQFGEGGGISSGRGHQA